MRKVVLITGGTRGIGLAVAIAFASQGDTVAISGRSDRSALEKAVTNLSKVSNREHSGVLLDVRDGNAVHDWVDKLFQRFGRVDVAIANAGVINPRPFLEIPNEQLDEVVDTHLKGTFHLLQAAGRAMIRKKTPGALITVTAPSATRAVDGVADYASAKGGIISLTRNVARELAPHGIRVNCIMPVADTRMTDALIKYRKTDREAWNRRYPLLGRMPQPEDITGPFIFLGSEESRCITGHVLGVDAGSGVRERAFM